MAVETVKGEEYTVEYNQGTQSVSFIGTIRLQTAEEYEPIMHMLHKAHDAAEPNATIYLDFRQLRFLNSSGINTISRFVIAARKQDKISLTALGNQDIYWQQKSLANLQRLWSKVQIKIQ
jgi:hypothetical protein